jgi:hypothetical protein
MFYSEARFLTLEEVSELAQAVGLRLVRSVSALLANPTEEPFEIERPRQGPDRLAGFAATLFRPQPAPPAQPSVRAFCQTSPGINPRTL